MSYFFIWFQHCLPHHALSSLVGFLANLRWPWWKNRFIRWFMHHYAVDMSLCEKKTPNEFTTFNDFFTRRLIPEALPKYTPRTLLSPISGRLISQGKISDLTLLQAKGHSFTLAALLGNYPPRAPLFREGHFLTFYLSPRDYHRVHMPLSGKLQEMFYIPGKLFSVNTLSTQKIPRLFARNERLVSMFETEMGPMAIIMVGALCVGSIETTWSHGRILALPKKQVRYFWYGSPISIELTQGQEMGHFQMGSTVIVLIPSYKIEWLTSIQTEPHVHVGQPIGIF